jgi:FlgN protein
MPMEDLSSILWRERDLLDMLLFKLEVEQLVLTNGRSHWLPVAAREIETVLEQIRSVDLLRAVAVDTVAAELSLDPSPSLSEIAQRSEEPWRAIWLDHREAFTSVATRISEMSQSNRVLLTAGYQAAQATLLSMTERSATYGSDGSVGSDRRTSLIDRNL